MNIQTNSHPHSDLTCAAHIVSEVARLGEAGRSADFANSLVRAYRCWVAGTGRFSTKQAAAMVKLSERFENVPCYTTCGHVVGQAIFALDTTEDLLATAGRRYSDCTGRHIELTIGDLRMAWEADSMDTAKTLAVKSRDAGESVRLRWVN